MTYNFIQYKYYYYNYDNNNKNNNKLRTFILRFICLIIYKC